MSKFKCTKCKITFQGSNCCGSQKCPKCGKSTYVMTDNSKVKSTQIDTIIRSK